MPKTKFFVVTHIIESILAELLVKIKDEEYCIGAPRRSAARPLEESGLPAGQVRAANTCPQPSGADLFVVRSEMIL